MKSITSTMDANEFKEQIVYFESKSRYHNRVDIGYALVCEYGSKENTMVQGDEIGMRLFLRSGTTSYDPVRTQKYAGNSVSMRLATPNEIKDLQNEIQANQTELVGYNKGDIIAVLQSNLEKAEAFWDRNEAVEAESHVVTMIEKLAEEKEADDAAAEKTKNTELGEQRATMIAHDPCTLLGSEGGKEGEHEFMDGVAGLY